MVADLHLLHLPICPAGWLEQQQIAGVDGIDWLRKRELLPRSSTTYRFNQHEVSVRTAHRVEETSNFEDWFGGRRSIEMNEDVIGLGSYGRTLTILYGIDVPEREDEDEEAGLMLDAALSEVTRWSGSTWLSIGAELTAMRAATARPRPAPAG